MPAKLSGRFRLRIKVTYHEKLDVVSDSNCLMTSRAKKNGSIFVPKGAYDTEFHYLLNNYRTHEQARYVPDSSGTDYQKTFHSHEIIELMYEIDKVVEF